MKLTAIYLDITLPAILKKDSVWIADLKLDFWIFPDLKRYILLDEDEWHEALEAKLFSQPEIDVCHQTVSQIRDCLEKGAYPEIFTGYTRSDASHWDRYRITDPAV
jgi:predicted RNA-binding protein associated with RNAse of E/G family